MRRKQVLGRKSDRSDHSPLKRLNRISRLLWPCTKTVLPHTQYGPSTKTDAMAESRVAVLRMGNGHNGERDYGDRPKRIMGRHVVINFHSALG